MKFLDLSVKVPTFWKLVFSFFFRLVSSPHQQFSPLLMYPVMCQCKGMTFLAGLPPTPPPPPPPPPPPRFLEDPSRSFYILGMERGLRFAFARVPFYLAPSPFCFSIFLTPPYTEKRLQCDFLFLTWALYVFFASVLSLLTCPLVASSFQQPFPYLRRACQ